MIPISSRGAFPLALALAVLALPQAYHAVARPTAISCANPEATLAVNFMPDARKQKAVSLSFDGYIDGTIGRLRLPGKWTKRTRFRVTRTYDLDRYYFVPRGNFTNIFSEDVIETIVVEVDGVALPLHLRLDESASASVSILTVYFYVLDGKPIVNPFWGSLRAAIPQILHGKLPLTMILANGQSETKDADAARATLIDWAQRAWTAYDQTCNP